MEQSIAILRRVTHLKGMTELDIRLLSLFEEAALRAGRIILDIYERGCAVETKADASPVTEADIAAEAEILAVLTPILPNIPVIAEEQMSQGIQPDISGGRFLLIDPLDGTREFVSRNGEFTVNIALIENGVPVAGIVYAPVLGTAYVGGASGAWKLEVGLDDQIISRKQIHVRERQTPPVALASRSHKDAFTGPYLDSLGVTECRTVGSSLKFGVLAEGEADIYARYNRTMEWDTAAGDAVLRAAGGMTMTADGTPLRYGKTGQTNDADFANPGFFAWGQVPSDRD